MLGTQTVISLLLKEFSDEGASYRFGSGWLLLVKASLLLTSAKFLSQQL